MCDTQCVIFGGVDDIRINFLHRHETSASFTYRYKLGVRVVKRLSYNHLLDKIVCCPTKCANP
jgi:hypothetical protein